MIKILKNLFKSDKHEHEFTIPYNTRGFYFMQCKHCSLCKDVTDHTNYKLEKAIKENIAVTEIYNHNKPIWDLSSDLYRRMNVILKSPLIYKFKMEVYNHLKEQNDALLLNTLKKQHERHIKNQQC